MFYDADIAVDVVASIIFHYLIQFLLFRYIDFNIVFIGFCSTPTGTCGDIEGLIRSALHSLTSLIGIVCYSWSELHKVSSISCYLFFSASAASRPRRRGMEGARCVSLFFARFSCSPLARPARHEKRNEFHIHLT